MGLFQASNILPTAGIYRFLYGINDSRLEQSVASLTFPNPVGLAAGFDKDGRWYRQLPRLGFGHVEIGTITGQPQPGNPRPRLFRLLADQAIINRMGFNNAGADTVARRLAQSPDSGRSYRLGINIGKSKIVALDQATSDYRFSFERLYSFADYFTVNVSSPNTPGLRELQQRDHLMELLQTLLQLNQELARDHETDPRPIFLKIAPDLSSSQLDDIVSIVTELNLPGLIATNTTIERTNLATPTQRVEQIGAGGLSGGPLTLKSRQIVSSLYRQLPSTTAIIGVGGIMTPADAWAMITAGASLVQLYTGFVYGGPGLIGQINRHLIQQLDEHGLANISQAVGLAHREKTSTKIIS